MIARQGLLILKGRLNSLAMSATVRACRPRQPLGRLVPSVRCPWRVQLIHRLRLLRGVMGVDVVSRRSPYFR